MAITYLSDWIHNMQFYMDYSYFCMSVPFLAILASSQCGQEAAAHGQVLEVSLGKSYEAGAGTSCHCSLRMWVTFTTQERGL